MHKRFVVTTAIGVVLATASFAQSPNDQTKQQQRTQDQRSQTQQPPGPASAQQAPSSGSATTQGQAPSTSGTAQSQPAQQPPAAQQSTGQTQQPPAAARPNVAQTPAQSNQPSTAQTPAQRQPSTAQTPAPSTAQQPSTAQTPTGQPPASKAQAPAQPSQPSTAQTPQQNTNVNATVNIGVQEQTRISQSISRLNVQPLTNVNFSVAVGTVVPRNIRLQTLPPDIVQIVPQYRNHSFVVVRDEIVIIEPSSYRIVAVLPRSGARAAAAPAGPPRQAQAKARFTDKERAAIRKHTTASRERVTTGSSARTEVRIGERVPETVRIIEFPATVYREVPSARAYRYIQLENRSYLVEPRERTIIEELD